MSGLNGKHKEFEEFLVATSEARENKAARKMQRVLQE